MLTILQEANIDEDVIEVIALLFSEKVNTYAMPDLGTMVLHVGSLLTPVTIATTFPSTTTVACSHIHIP
jgi:hypothetical protein